MRVILAFLVIVVGILAINDRERTKELTAMKLKLDLAVQRLDSQYGAVGADIKALTGAVIELRQQ